MATSKHAIFDDIHTRLNTLHPSLTRVDVFEAVSELLSPYDPSDLAELKAWLPEPAMCPVRRLDAQRAYPMILVTMAHLARAHGDDLPDWYLDYLPSAAILRHTVPDSALEVFDLLDDQALVHTIELTFLHEPFARDTAIKLIARIQDQALYETMITMVQERSSADDLTEPLAHDTARVMPVLRKIRQPEDHAIIKLMLQLANKRCEEEDDDLYLEALGHKLKGFRELAQLGISARGEFARPLLERGIEARKKAVREWCVTQLEVLGDAPEQMPEKNPYEQLSEEEQAAMGERIDELYQKPDKLTESWIKNEVSKDPVLWMHVLMSLFASNPRFIHRWAIFKKLLTHKATAPHHKTMWRLYLEHLARNPRVDDSHTQWHLKKHFDLIPSDYAQEVFDLAIKGASAPMTIPMYEHYFAAQFCTPETLEFGLKHKSKKVRDAAVKGAAHWPEDADAALIVALRSERKKVTRQVAAEALFNMPIEAITPHAKTIASWLADEKDEVTQGALEAINARIKNA